MSCFDYQKAAGSSNLGPCCASVWIAQLKTQRFLTGILFRQWHIRSTGDGFGNLDYSEEHRNERDIMLLRASR